MMATKAEQAAARMRAEADSEHGRFHLPAELAPADVPGGFRFGYEDGSQLEVRALPATRTPVSPQGRTVYAAGTAPAGHGGGPVVTCTTPDGVTAGMLIMRTPEGAAAVAAALNLDAAATGGVFCRCCTDNECECKGAALGVEGARR
jgi:hypothetical protein